MGFKIREFTVTDLADCLKLGREIVDYHRKIYEDSKIPYRDTELREKLLNRNENCMKFVAVKDNKVVGLLILMIKKERGSLCEIEDLVVAESERGRGIGTALLNHAKKVAAEKVCDEIVAKVSARNISAINFYHKNGLMYIGMVELFMPISKKRKRNWDRIRRKLVFHTFECYC